MELFNFSPLIIAIVPVIIGLVSVAKGAGLPDRFAPILAIVFGIGLVALTGPVLAAIIAQGIIAGLAAAGLYSGVKATVATA